MSAQNQLCMLLACHVWGSLSLDEYNVYTANGPPSADKLALCSQAQAQSQAQAAARERRDVTRSPQDAAETWRRHIYIEGLYAQPMGMAQNRMLRVFPFLAFHCCLPHMHMQELMMQTRRLQESMAGYCCCMSIFPLLLRKFLLVKPTDYLPHAETGPAVAVPPVIPEERKQQRVEAWVDRELRALLQTDDIAIVRAYVMGLVRGIGFAARQVCCTVRTLHTCHLLQGLPFARGRWYRTPSFVRKRPSWHLKWDASASSHSWFWFVTGRSSERWFLLWQEGAEGSAGRAAGSARTDATAALKPFLHEHAAHFWHELR